MNRKILALLLVGLLAAPAAMAADAKLKVTLDAGGGPNYRAGEIYNGTIAAAARDSTRIVDARDFKQIWVALYVKGSTAAALGQPCRIAFHATDFACMDSANVAEGLKGYPNGDTTQNIRGTLALPDLLGATTDTLCREAWNPTGIRQTTGAAGLRSESDTTYVGMVDTTWAAATKTQPNELLVMVNPRRANQGTTSERFPMGVYKFPLADLNGIFFRARYLQLRFRNLSVGSVVIRCRIELYKD
jgi:hypothetical protein